MQKRRSMMTIGLVSALALVGAACASDDDDDVAADGEGGEFQPGELGAVTVEPGEPILIGVLQSITGGSASLGTDQVRAIEVLVEEDMGGELLGHPIELQTEDGQCRSEGGTTAAQRLVAEEQLVGVVGTSCSGEAVPASEILADEGIVMISGSNTAPNLTSDLEGNEGDAFQETYFRVAHNDTVQGQAAATYAFEDLGARRAVTIHDGDPYTQGLATAFTNSFEELGGEVVLGTAVGPDDTDMRPVLTEVAATEPDLMFFPIFQPAADHVVQQATEFEPLQDTGKLMGADGLLADTFISIGETEGMYFSGPATPEGAAYEDLVTKYEEKFGEAPIQSFHAHAYDSTSMLFQAIEAVAQEEDDGTLHIDRQALLDEVAGTEGFEGLTGSLTCDEFGDCADPAIDIVRNTEEMVTINEVRDNILFTFEPEE